MTSADKEAIQTSWANYLYTETAVEEESGFPTWAIVLIVCGSVVVVAAAVLIPLLIVLHKKKLKAKEAEATVNAYKRKKIDTTDDKSIDVYADEETVEPTETPVEESPVEEVPAEETPGEPVEEVSETSEVVEEPTETAVTTEENKEE
jgi:outer membrane biosynthesis protein TonB